jgi:hypothetical protein
MSCDAMVNYYRITLYLVYGLSHDSFMSGSLQPFNVIGATLFPSGMLWIACRYIIREEICVSDENLFRQRLGNVNLCICTGLQAFGCV